MDLGLLFVSTHWSTNQHTFVRWKQREMNLNVENLLSKTNFNMFWYLFILFNITIGFFSYINNSQSHDQINRQQENMLYLLHPCSKDYRVNACIVEYFYYLQ